MGLQVTRSASVSVYDHEYNHRKLNCFFLFRHWIICHPPYIWLSYLGR